MDFSVSCSRTIATASVALACAIGSPAAANTDPVRFAGTWQLADEYQASVTTVDGALPPLNEAGQALLDQRIAEREAGETSDGVEVCLPPGTPRIMWQDRPFMLLYTPAKITIVHEFQHTLRHIYLGEDLPPAEELNLLYGGTSAARWEGDVLVVQTAGFNDNIWIDATGLPQSAEAVIEERVQLIDDDTLEASITITDPAYYDEPWTTVIRYERAPEGTQLAEHNCAEKLLHPSLRDRLNVRPYE